MYARIPSLTLVAANQHSLTICFSADAATSRSSMSRRPQSTSPRVVWGRQRSRCVGLSPISPKSNWNHLHATRGMIAGISFSYRTGATDCLRPAGRPQRQTGGHVVVSTFCPEDPTKCSGLEVMRYDADSLHREFGARFRLIESSKELHHTPSGTTQQFLYCYCRID